MKIHHSLSQFKESVKNPVLTIGTFDGVHVGHQKIIQKLNEKAKKIGGSSVLFTFYPHPRQVLFPGGDSLQLIQTQKEKEEKLERMGLDHLIICPFTIEFSRLSAIEFVRSYLVNQIDVQVVVIGYDHHFGRNREGTLEQLTELAPVYDFEVQEISAQDIDDVNVSSTKIRNAILSGDFEIANQYLGEPFQVEGLVVDGEKIGRTLGYPTANVSLDDKDKILPPFGVYIVIAKVLDQEYKAVASFGLRPTVTEEVAPKLEVFILDFEKNIYDLPICVRFIRKLRDEIKFETKDELRNQIIIDEHNTREWFDTHNAIYL